MDLIAIAVAIFIFLLILNMSMGSKVQIPEKLVIQKKQCPPHQWFWQEIVDQDGNKQGERIVCKVCGPLRSIGESSDEV